MTVIAHKVKTLHRKRGEHNHKEILKQGKGEEGDDKKFVVVGLRWFTIDDSIPF